jgi:uncharacterized protein (TIGR01777 family)
MNLLIAGASGLIGQELVTSLFKEHQITVLGRTKNKLSTLFPKEATYATWDELDLLNANTFDAVINLSGSNIAASRWSPKVKAELIHSRVYTSQTLIRWLVKNQAKPHFYCANAVGIYGLQEDGEEQAFTEDSVIDLVHPVDFLSEIGIRWQEALEEAEKAGLAVTTTRFGVVLKKRKGFLGKLYPSFIYGLGSVIGSGRHYLSWVDSEDLVNAYRFLLHQPQMTGPINITAPNPCTQKEFAKAYAKSLHRPLLLTTPTFVIRLLFGEMGESLINHGQKVIPKRLLEAGFIFKKPTIEEALN